MGQTPPPLPSPIAAAPKLAGMVQEIINSVIDNPLFKEGLILIGGALVPNMLANWAEFGLQTRINTLRRLGALHAQAEADLEPELVALAAQAIGDLFHVPVLAASIMPAHQGGDARAAGGAIGEAVLQGLFGAFGGLGGTRPEAGTDNLKRLLSMVVGVAIDGWIGGAVNLGFLTEQLPEFGKLKETVERHIGFGRIVPRAMRPLVDLLIQQPTRTAINRSLLPSQPTEAMLVRMLNRGAIKDTEYFSRSEDLGWSRERAAELIAQHSEHPGVSELRPMLQLGIIKSGEVRALLLARGMMPDIADKVIQVIEQDRVLPLRNEFVSLARAMYAERVVTESELRTACQTALYTPEETDLVVALGQLQRSRPKTLTVAQASELFLAGVWDEPELRAFLELEKYAGADVESIIALELTKKAKAEGRAAELARKLPAPGAEDVPQATAEQLYRRGMIDRARLTVLLEAAGLKGDRLAAQLALADAERKAFADAIARHQAPKPAVVPKQGTIEALFVRGLVDQAALAAFYTGAGFAPTLIPLLLQLRDAERLEWQAAHARKLAPPKPRAS